MNVALINGVLYWRTGISVLRLTTKVEIFQLPIASNCYHTTLKVIVVAGLPLLNVSQNPMFVAIRLKFCSSLHHSELYSHLQPHAQPLRDHTNNNTRVCKHLLPGPSCVVPSKFELMLQSASLASNYPTIGKFVQQSSWARQQFNSQCAMSEDDDATWLSGVDVASAVWIF